MTILAAKKRRKTHTRVNTPFSAILPWSIIDNANNLVFWCRFLNMLEHRYLKSYTRINTQCKQTYSWVPTLQASVRQFDFSKTFFNLKSYQIIYTYLNSIDLCIFHHWESKFQNRDQKIVK